MKKSYIKSLTMFAFATMALSSCSLDMQPTTQYRLDTFWKTESACEAYVASCYTPLTSTNVLGNCVVVEDAATPYFYDGDNTCGYGHIALGQHNSSSSGVIRGRWHDCYIGIGRCNTILAHIDDMAVPILRKKTIEGEARFLRALYYYMLEAYYGDVPLILGEPEYAFASLPRTDRKEVVEVMIDDLNTAYQLLEWKPTELGRASKGAALGLKARVQIFEASPLVNVDNDQQKWRDAYNTLAGFYDTATKYGGYDLFDDYRKMFLPANEHNCECVFNVEFSQENDAPSNSFSLYSVQYRCNAPTMNLVELYEGLTTDYKKQWSSRDARFAATVFYPGCTFLGKDSSKMTDDEAVSYIGPQTGFAFKKLTIYDEQPRLSGNLKPENETNYMFIRYADILLMYAEAINELNTAPNARCYEAINKVRARAGLSALSGLTKEQMRKAILNERIVELAGEGIIYTDLRRLKRGDMINNISVRTCKNLNRSTTRFDESRDYWWPVPQNELDLNDKLSQNVGY